MVIFREGKGAWMSGPMMAGALLVLSAIIGLSGCSLFQHVEEVKPSGPKYEVLPGSLENEYFHTPTGDVAGMYPKEWLMVDVSRMPDMDGVLDMFTDKERASALILSEIAGTPEFRRNVERDGISALADESFRRKSRRSQLTVSITQKPEVFTLENKLFASYEYAIGPITDTVRGPNRMGRVIVFTTGARFYELAMVELRTDLPAERRTLNFRLLQSVIGTLEGVASVRSAPTGAEALNPAKSSTE